MDPEELLEIEEAPAGGRPWDGRQLGQLGVSMLLGALLMLGALSLANRVRPAPIVIEPPRPTATAGPTATPAPVQVYVNGAVARPDVYELPAGGIVRDALAAAGGLTDGAAAAGVNLAQPLYDGLQVYVPFEAEAAAAPPAGPQTAGPSGGEGALGRLLDLNRATPAQLETLPGIGPSTAARIVAYREENGPFTSVEDLLQVSGIGEGKLAEVRGLVFVGDEEGAGIGDQGSGERVP